MPSSHLILCRPLLLLPPIPPSIRVFSNESTLRMRWSKYWSFSFSIIPSKEIPGLISFRMDWLDLLAVQGTLKTLLQHHNSKASILQRSAFFTVQLSYPMYIYKICPPPLKNLRSGSILFKPIGYSTQYFMLQSIKISLVHLLLSASTSTLLAQVLVCQFLF